MNDILTIEDVAQYLRVSEHTVYDWAQKGAIPAGKIGTVWRFKREELEKWVNARLSGNTEDVEFLEKNQKGDIHVETFLSPDRVLFLNHSTRQDALFALAENLATAPQVKNRRELVEQILKRDAIMSTAIGRGIAIPHVRLASVTDLVASVGISRTEIVDFQPLDDEPVHLLFMIAAARNQHAYYLQTLSFFSAHLRNQGLRNSLLNAQTEKEVWNILISIG
ncbi:MAG: PTS sugar transporter subunit IIA [Treponema sp.]|jgi:PTS system nitrogen regulatory IIA component|nr:PTS sugar transporter subunit IIA [Treponema sp.]